MKNYWIFTNNYLGYYGDSDWDTSTILRSSQYYFKDNEPNRKNVKEGDFVILRTYGEGFWGTCIVSSGWIIDKKGRIKHKQSTGWFEIKQVMKWTAVLPFEIVKPDLSNQGHRQRIAKIKEEDWLKIHFAYNIYSRLGYGSIDGNFFILENGIEEAIKKNLSQLDLKLAPEAIRQQCNLGIGIGRTDLICVDEKGNYIVLELKAVESSDTVVGQISRYIGYIQENWAEKENKKVKGIIITPGYDEQLRLAAKAAGIKVLRIKIG
jgi:restriction system protein